jgi:hypothetical protein
MLVNQSITFLKDVLQRKYVQHVQGQAATCSRTSYRMFKDKLPHVQGQAAACSRTSYRMFKDKLPHVQGQAAACSRTSCRMFKDKLQHCSTHPFEQIFVQ